MTETRPCQVVTTIDSREAADRLARATVEARLAACAQVTGPVSSTYRWQGTIESADEWQITFKTTTQRYEDLAAFVRERHGYAVPEILQLPVDAGHPPYLAWLVEQTQPPPP